MHGGILHLVLNCWAIFVFGREVEAALGRKSFLTLYFSSGIIGGLFQAALGKALTDLFHNPSYLWPTGGAAAGGLCLPARRRGGMARRSGSVPLSFVFSGYTLGEDPFTRGAH